jgi:hypothetical protein
MHLWALVLVAAFAAIPTPSFSWVDGLPIDRPAEFILFAVLATLIASTAARRATFEPLSPAGARALAVAATAGIALKMVLVAHGGQTGFIACYHGGSTPATSGCDRSFDDPFQRFSATRIDPQIQFEGNDWRLGLLNSLRFDALRRDDAYLPPVPFSVEWESVTSASSPQQLRVRYRGEATVSIDAHVDAFPADYSESGATHAVTFPEGRHRVVTSYRFAPPDAPDSPAAITSASMHLDARTPMRWGTANRLDLVGAWAIDGLALIVFGLLAAGVVSQAPRDAALVGAVVIVVLVIAAAPVGAYARDKLLELIIVAGCVCCVWSGRPGIPLAVSALALLCAMRVGSATGPAPGITDYRMRFDDGLTYESFAHTILEERSLQGGENVFTLQILFRYIRFTERMLFGEADWLLLAAVLTSLNVSYAWLGRRVQVLSSGYGPALLFITSTMLWMMNSASGSIEAPMSEYPTWVLLPAMVGLLFLGRTRRDWLIGATMMGAATLTRFNQFPAYALLLLVFGWAPSETSGRPGWRDVAWCVAVVALITFGFPLAHNYWYGNALTVLPTNRYSTLVIDLSPRAFWSADQRQVWAMFIWKIRLLAHVGLDKAYATSWFVPLHLLQLAVLAVAIAVWRGRLRPLPGHTWLLAAPVVALGVHLFYVVHFYYPRHIMFGYLLGGVVALVLIAENGLMRSRAGSQDSSDLRCPAEHGGSFPPELKGNN